MDELKQKRERLLLLETTYCYDTNYNIERNNLKKEIKNLKYKRKNGIN